MNALVG